MGALRTGGRFVHQGLFGSTLAAAILSVTDVLGAKTFEIEVEGDAWPTGDHEFVFHHDDPSLLMP
jgi:proline racemase